MHCVMATTLMFASVGLCTPTLDASTRRLTPLKSYAVGLLYCMFKYLLLIDYFVCLFCFLFNKNSQLRGT